MTSPRRFEEPWGLPQPARNLQQQQQQQPARHRGPEDRFTLLENRVASLETRLGPRFARVAVPIRPLSPQRPVSPRPLVSQWGPGALAPRYADDLAAEALQMGRMGEDTSEFSAWRHTLDQWRADLVSGLSHAATELGGLQEDVDALQHHLDSLRGHAGLPGLPRRDLDNRTATPSSITTRLCRVESLMDLEFMPLRADMHDFQMKNRSDDVHLLKSSMHSLSNIGDKLDSKVDVTVWRETNLDINANIQTIYDIARSVHCEFDTWRNSADDTLSAHYDNIQKLLVRAQVCMQQQQPPTITNVEKEPDQDISISPEVSGSLEKDQDTFISPEISELVAETFVQAAQARNPEVSGQN